MTSFEMLSIMLGIVGVLTTLLGIIVKLIIEYINAKK